MKLILNSDVDLLEIIKAGHALSCSFGFDKKIFSFKYQEKLYKVPKNILCDNLGDDFVKELKSGAKNYRGF